MLIKQGLEIVVHSHAFHHPSCQVGSVRWQAFTIPVKSMVTRTNGNFNQQKDHEVTVTLI